MITLTPYELLQFQLQHYAHRFAEARTIEERSFLRSELFRLKTLAYDNK